MTKPKYLVAEIHTTFTDLRFLRTAVVNDDPKNELLLRIDDIRARMKRTMDRAETKREEGDERIKEISTRGRGRARRIST